MEISPSHPRYKSLLLRERLAEAMREGIVTATGLIAHGRGEAYDYMMGERTTPSADEAERVAACHLLEAERPVLCVNGNAAVVAGKEIIELAKALPAKVEVNLFHRSAERMEKVISYMESLGDVEILGRKADAFIEGIASERAKCSSEGIGSADVILVPIEDGDRAQALVAMGKVVIAIDLNPLSRTSRTASVPIVDEASRAVRNITHYVNEFRQADRRVIIENFDKERTLRSAVEEIKDFLTTAFDER